MAITDERRDTVPSVDEIALGLTYAETRNINPVTVALRYPVAEELHAALQETLDNVWALIDAAKNRP